MDASFFMELSLAVETNTEILASKLSERERNPPDSAAIGSGWRLGRLIEERKAISPDERWSGKISPFFVFRQREHGGESSDCHHAAMACKSGEASLSRHFLLRRASVAMPRRHILAILT